jgi:hypothetical protein
MGFRPETGHTTRTSGDPDRAERFFSETAELTRRMLSGLPTNRELIGQIAGHRMQRI